MLPFQGAILFRVRFYPHGVAMGYNLIAPFDDTSSKFEGDIKCIQAKTA